MAQDWTAMDWLVRGLGASRRSSETKGREMQESSCNHLRRWRLKKPFFSKKFLLHCTCGLLSDVSARVPGGRWSLPATSSLIFGDTKQSLTRLCYLNMAGRPRILTFLAHWSTRSKQILSLLVQIYHLTKSIVRIL